LTTLEAAPHSNIRSCRHRIGSKYDGLSWTYDKWSRRKPTTAVRQRQLVESLCPLLKFGRFRRLWTDTDKLPIFVRSCVDGQCCDRHHAFPHTRQLVADIREPNNIDRIDARTLPGSEMRCAEQDIHRDHDDPHTPPRWAALFRLCGAAQREAHHVATLTTESGVRYSHASVNLRGALVCR
jgi:hypothetical protein